MGKRQGKQKLLHNYVIYRRRKRVYDWVPRQGVWIWMREEGVSDKNVRKVHDMFDGARNRIKSSGGLTDNIPVGVGLHQGSSLSPYLFAMIIDVLACGINDRAYVPVAHAISWCHCIVWHQKRGSCNNTGRVGKGYGRQGAEFSRKKNVYLRFNGDGNLDGNSYINLQGKNIERVNIFKLWATLTENGDLDAEVTHSIQSGWTCWKRVSEIMCVRKVYKTVERPAMMYGAETWAVKKAREKKLDVAGMTMLC